MKKIIFAIMFIYPINCFAFTPCEALGSMSGSILYLKSKNHTEEKTEEIINNTLNKYKDRFTYNEFRKLKQQLEVIIEKTYEDKKLIYPSDNEIRNYGEYWKEKCEMKKIRIY